VAEFHFVEDYERLVAGLIAKHPIEEAMSLAVGGHYDQIGQVEGQLLRWAGLANGMSVVDLGCGSGRLPHALGKAFAIDYLGVDIVQALLDYAATKSPTNYRFVLNRSLTLPADDKSADFVTAFSVFTHLLPSESYLYMEDARRVLKPGGKLVFSFLEVVEPSHWFAFEGEVNSRRAGGSSHLNMMLERPMIKRMAETLGYSEPTFIGGSDAPWGGQSLGQSVVITSPSSDRP